MASSHLPKDLAQQAVDTLAAYNGNRTEAAKSLGIARSTFGQRLEIAMRRYGIKSAEKNPTVKQTEAQSVTDMLRRQMDRIAKESDALRKENKRLREGQLSAELVREIISGSNVIPNPPDWFIEREHQSNHGVPTLLCSDWHWGETVEARQVNYVNAFNKDIAERRWKRMVEKTINLMLVHMAKPKYDYLCFPLLGDMLCFPEGTLITDGNGRSVPIEEIQPGMRVMGNPQDQLVTQVHVRDPRPGETLLRMKCAKIPPIEATPGHVVAVLPREVVETGWNPGGKRGIGFTVRDKSMVRESDIQWRAMAEIRPGDYLVNNPWRPTDQEDTFDLREITGLPLSQDGRKLLRKVRGLSPAVISEPVIQATNDLLWAIGLFVAEGNYMRGRSGEINCAQVTLGIHERHIAERWQMIIDRQFGYVPIIRENPKVSTIVIHANNQIIATFLHKLVGDGAFGKCLSPRLFRMGRSLLPLVAGWIDGDGCMNKGGIYGKTVSPVIARQMLTILNTEQCFPSYFTDDHGLNRTAHIVRVSGENAQLLGSYTSRFADRIKEFIPTYNESLSFDGHIGYRVKSITEIPATTKLYDLTIDGEPCYQAGGVLVHNSGNIHEELRENNWAPISLCIIEFRDHLIWAIDEFLNAFKKVYLPCVTGNHGRMDRKPRYKNATYDNYEFILYEMLRHHYKGNKAVHFEIADSSELLYQVCNTRYLAVHGDGFKGGSGIAGALSPMMIGRARKKESAMATNRLFDVMIHGHWHFYRNIGDIISNGAGKGFDDYALKNSFQYQAPIQALWVTHPDYGITVSWPIYLQEKNERYR